MSDKLLHEGFNLPEFALGEQPSPLKINNAFAGFWRRMEKISEYLSDINSVLSANDILSNRPLTTASIGRALGPIGSIQPPVPVHQDFTWSIKLETGFNEWLLPLRPYNKNGDRTWHLTVPAAATDYDGNVVFSNEVVDWMPLSGNGQFKYLPEQNKLVSFATLVGTDITLTATSYIGARNGTAMPDTWYSGNASPNVMPPWQVSPSTSITVAVESDPLYDYVITMHPEKYVWDTPPVDTNGTRMSTSAIDAASSSFELSRMGALPRFDVSSYIEQTLPYQIQSLTLGDTIPTPFVRLYQEGTNGSVITAGTYYYKDQTSFYYKGAALDLGAQYRVVSPGGFDVSDAIQGLQFFAQHHRHAGPQAVSHRDLLNQGYHLSTDKLPVAAMANDPALGWQRPTHPSTWEGNPHPQYLHRMGYYDNADPSNMNGLMLGDLAIGLKATNLRTAGVADVYGSGPTATDKESWALDFGGRAKIRLSKNQNDVPFLALEPTGAKGIGIGDPVYGTLENNSHGYWVLGENNLLDNSNNSTAVFHMIQGEYNYSYMNNSYASYAHVIGKNSRADIVGSEHSWIEMLSNGGTALINDSLNTRLRYQGGGGRATMSTLTGANVDIAQSGSEDITVDSQLCKDYGSYIKRESYIVDANYRPVQRAITPDKIQFMAGIDSGAANYGDHAISGTSFAGIALTPFVRNGRQLLNNHYVGGDRAYFHVADHDFEHLAGIMFLDLPADAHLSQIEVYMEQTGLSISLHAYQMNGSSVVLDSTTLATPLTGSLFTWTLGTGIGTKGPRFPNLNGSAIDVALVFEKISLTDKFKIRGGTYTYNVMRF